MDAVEKHTLMYRFFSQWGIYLLVFLLVLVLALTFAHPELLLTDEWITVNQLHQLHDGHQLLINEGKYGVTEDGTLNAYFAARGNRLAYPLFLPLISLPALWLVDLFGDHFVFGILYLWTGLLLLMILGIQLAVPGYSRVGRWRWTPAAAGIVLLVFFINLLYYTPFSVTRTDSYPEILAVAFTNIILFACAGLLIFEINRTLFDETSFSFFGTFACLFSSSYFFWSTGCKDHVLTLLLFTGVILGLVKYRKTGDSWYLVLAFLVTGLLAWARPELALWTCIFLVLFWGYEVVWKSGMHYHKEHMPGYCSPLFTLIGALPFFLNNILITRNPLLPPNALYLSGVPAGTAVAAASYLQEGADLPGTSLSRIFFLKPAGMSSDILRDVFGVLIHPSNGSMGVLSLTPLLVVMAVLAIVLILAARLHFSPDEISVIALVIVTALPVFIAYTNNLSQLNTSMGITPDIRYLSPAYVPLILLGLLLMRKIPVTGMSPIRILAMTGIISAVGIPLSLYLTAKAYSDPAVAAQLDAPLSAAFSAIIFSLIAIALLVFLWSLFSKRGETLSGVLIALLCALPFIWQITISVRFWGFAATAQGYPAWIPILRILNTILATPLISH